MFEKPVRVLLIDDALFMRDIYREALDDEEFEVVGEAANGKEAVEKFGLLRPDLVILDLQVLDTSGIEVLKNILRQDANAQVVIVSSIGQEKQVISAIEEGAKDFVVKPFKAEAFKGVCKKVLS